MNNVLTFKIRTANFYKMLHKVLTLPPFIESENYFRKNARGISSEVPHVGSSCPFACTRHAAKTYLHARDLVKLSHTLHAD